MLSGYRVIGKVFCYQGGHELTNNFLKKLFKSQSHLSFIELEDIIITKKIRPSQPIKIAVNA